MRQSLWFVGTILIAACGEPPIAGHEAAVSTRLEAVPVWTADGPDDTPGTCFGVAVAVADLDGDGEAELVTVELGCFYQLAAPGRIAIYRGEDGAFAETPVWTTLAWPQATRPVFSATLATGDVDGDGRADLMVANPNGVLVYAGIASVAAPLGAPRYQVPGTGRFGRAILADVDGDRRSEIVSVRGTTATVWRPAGGALVAARTIEDAAGVVAAGDVNGDGRDDVVVGRADGSSALYRGCAGAGAGCVGGLRATPAWGFDRAIVAMTPDLDGDGRKDALVRDAGQSGGWLWLHTSTAAGLAAAPAWSTLGDPAYPVFGAAVVFPDLDGDERTEDFVVAAAGRSYAFFPRRPHHLDALAPGFAWPRENGAMAQLLGGEATFGDSVMALAAAGDLDGDGYGDLVIGAPAAPLDQKPGTLYLFRGGKVRPGGGHGHDKTPYLPGEVTCGLASGGLPDLTVDAAVLARSIYVEERSFAADACELAEACVGGPGVRKLLRFTTSIANLGAGPVVIPGPETAPELYVFDECHGHDHLENFARYELVDASGAVVAVGRKQGFFLIDLAPYCSDGPSAADYFPDQGISPGWADVYVSSIPCQWLDVTDVPNGRYSLRVTADAEHLIEQDDVRPDTATVRIKLQADRVQVLP